METILIVDFGSQYNQLISRRIRELGVYSKIVPWDTVPSDVGGDIIGIILSGGPGHAADEDAPVIRDRWLNGKIPVLGICYGMQAMIGHAGGSVGSSGKREYGKHRLHLRKEHALTAGMDDQTTVWMSHGDAVEALPEGFGSIATSGGTIAAVADDARRLYGVQFHPEVTHTEQGRTLLKNFVLTICGASQTWDMRDQVDRMMDEIREVIGDDDVILGLSGGVDSSVTAALLHRAVGDRLTCLFVDTGLLRKHEAEEVMAGYGGMPNLNVEKIDARERFFDALKGVADPEEKRKIIGHVFFDVFSEAAKRHKQARFLAQGTIYPDVIESMSVHGPSATIKSHHNVGGVPEKHGFTLIEPLRRLFKDEVREVGRALGLSPSLVDRHPFPGPGLAIRVIGEVTPAKVAMLQDADRILTDMLRDRGLYHEVAQAFCVLLPVKSVGVMGDRRTHEFVCAVRCVDTTDFMTAEPSALSHAFLGELATRIVNDVKGINRIVYDITSKPPGTIEWE